MISKSNFLTFMIVLCASYNLACASEKSPKPTSPKSPSTPQVSSPTNGQPAKSQKSYSFKYVPALFTRGGARVHRIPNS